MMTESEINVRSTIYVHVYNETASGVGIWHLYHRKTIQVLHTLLYSLAHLHTCTCIHVCAVGYGIYTMAMKPAGKNNV